MGYSFRLAARVLLYASSHRQDNTYHGLCYTSRGALAGTRNIYGRKLKNHTDNDRGNPLPLLHGLLFFISSNVLLYARSHRQDNTYHDLCYTFRQALAGTRNDSMDRHQGSIRRPTAPRANALPRSYISIPIFKNCECKLY